MPKTDAYMVRLLEAIAWNTSGRTEEKEAYLAKIKGVKGPYGRLIKNQRVAAGAAQADLEAKC